jgi:hypothetical protein
MTTLRKLQVDMLQALFGRTDAAVRHVRGDGLPPERRLGVYRHNMFASLTSALAAVYPTVAALVGEGFFRFMAHEYILAQPSRSGNLHEFGAELPAFLQGFEPAASLPYLPDSARLDWAWHAAFHADVAAAPDAPAALMRIGAMSDAARLALKLQWQPAARLVASAYPVLAIWRLHQQPLPPADDDTPLVDVDAGGDCVLVARRGGELLLERLEPAEHALLAALGRGDTLGDAVAAALQVDAGFDVAAAIAHHLALGTLAGLQEPPA